MPGTRLAFAVGVGRQQHDISLDNLLAQGRYGLFPVLGDDIIRLEAACQGYAQAVLGQVAQVSQAGPGKDRAAQDRARQGRHGFGFVRRFDDEQGFHA